MKNNSELQQDVQNAIQGDTCIYTAGIDVTAKDGWVTL